MVNVILCGGNGTRLWPISRSQYPKQFIKLIGKTSLFQKTVLRNCSLCEKFFVVSNSEHYSIVNNQLNEIEEFSNSFLLEPIGRNTAPAIALACLSLDPEEIVLVTPSDHLINNQSEYKRVVENAKILAEDNNIVTFGITPSYPEIGYGYIETDEGNDVMSFKEKPDIQTAKKYLESEKYYWNSGIFCFKAGVFLANLEQYSNEIYQSSVKAFENADKFDSKIEINFDDMQLIPEDSIDYAVMEKSKVVKIVTADIGWNDLGSFDSLFEESNSFENKNIINIDSKNNLVLANKKVALIDIEDLIVVDTDDALLISKKGSSQKVKDVVKVLKDDKSELSNLHLTVHRPWGFYTILESEEQYKLKKIVVKPGERLSLQKHFHRSEHWIVVSGTAKVTIAKDEYLVRKNESTYIPIGQNHRLENPGIIDLILIEAQVGEYTGEDDIVRIQDDYKRK